MKLTNMFEKGILLTPVLFTLFVFFIPLSPSLKSIFFALGIASVLFNPNYNQYLIHAFNSYWGRIVVLFVAYIALACAWSPAPFALQMSVLSKYSKLLYLPILAVGFINSKTRTWCINAYLASMIVTLIVAVLKYKGLVHIGDPDDLGDLFYNHIMTGFMMSLACYFALIYAFKTNGWQRIMYFFVAAIASFQVLFMNTGRTGYVMYLILIALFLVQKLPIKKAILGLFAFAGVILLAYSLSPVMQKGVQVLIDDLTFLQKNNLNESVGSLGLRLQFHDYAHALFLKHPLFGIGTGGFQYRFAQDQPMPLWGPVLNDPHSQYWMTLSEQGLIGGLFLFSFIACLLRASFKLKENRAVLWGVLTAFCVGSFFDTILCYSTAGYLLIIISASCFGEFIEQFAEVKNKVKSELGSKSEEHLNAAGSL